MRLFSRSRHQRQRKVPRIAISQAEITADLLYPAGRQASGQQEAISARRGSGR